MYALIKFIYFLSGFASFMTLRKTGMFIGSAFHFFSRKRRKVALKNAMLIGAENPEDVVRSSFRNNFATFAESFYTKRIDQKFIDEIEIEDNSGVDISSFSPFFMLTAHIGAWELSAYIVSMIYKLKITIIGRRLKSEKLDDFVVQQRTNEYVSYLHHRNIADKLGGVIDSKESVGALLDHGATLRDSFFVPFFGLNTTFIKGIPMLAARKNVPVICAFVIRTEKGYKLICYPVIRPDETLKPKERIHKIAEDINRTYEDIIRKYPDQWYLMHKRFKKYMNEKGEIIDSFYQ